MIPSITAKGYPAEMVPFYNAKLAPLRELAEVEAAFYGGEIIKPAPTIAEDAKSIHIVFDEKHKTMNDVIDVAKKGFVKVLKKLLK